MRFYGSKMLIVIRLQKSCTPAGGSRGAGGGEMRRQTRVLKTRSARKTVPVESDCPVREIVSGQTKLPDHCSDLRAGLYELPLECRFPLLPAR